MMPSDRTSPDTVTLTLRIHLKLRGGSLGLSKDPALAVKDILLSDSLLPWQVDDVEVERMRDLEIRIGEEVDGAAHVVHVEDPESGTAWQIIYADDVLYMAEGKIDWVYIVQREMAWREVMLTAATPYQGEERRRVVVE